MSSWSTGRCGVPLTNPRSNSHLADKFLTRMYFASGERVHYMCDIGYGQVGGSRYRRCTNGNWSPLLLKCERRWCGSAGEISNGQFTYTGVQFGDTATAVCDEGYQLVGKPTRICVNDGWDGRVPVCEAVVCDEPPEVANAKRTEPIESSYIYRSVVAYQCLVGTIIGPKEIYCTEDGTWSSAPPECKEITCPSPNVPNASWVRAQTDQYQYKDTISIMCDPRFRIRGKSTITCGRDGKWLPEVPSCRPKPLCKSFFFFFTLCTM
uniref:Sushi domain-containing protein n=1 Tax=Sphaeramia orbicularis TaxID=375764 RepID=A0A672ZG62_9TELE